MPHCIANCNAIKIAKQNAYLSLYMQYHINNWEVVHMAFQLKPNRKESENKTIRFPLPLVEKINEAIENQEVTFSSFVIQACEYALENMENPN